MYFDSWSEFFAMGGHGLYVWLAWGFFLMVILWNLVAPLMAKTQVLKSVRRHWRRVKDGVEPITDEETAS